MHSQRGHTLGRGREGKRPGTGLLFVDTQIIKTSPMGHQCVIITYGLKKKITVEQNLDQIINNLKQKTRNSTSARTLNITTLMKLWWSPTRLIKSLRDHQRLLSLVFSALTESFQFLSTIQLLHMIPLPKDLVSLHFTLNRYINFPSKYLIHKHV